VGASGRSFARRGRRSLAGATVRDGDDLRVNILVLVAIVVAVVWISRWDLRRPDAVEARERNRSRVRVRRPAVSPS
jgi:hypothetical protein